MTRFIEKPNLPEGRVSSLICGGLNAELRDFFSERGIELYYTAENKCADKSVSDHCDLSVLYLGNGKIIVDKGQAFLISRLREKGLEVVETFDEVSGAYPHDCILNHTIIGDCIIGKKEIFDKAVLDYCKNFEHIQVRQGYCKCSVLVVDERSVITDDESIAAKVCENGLDCLLISKGDVFLDGHEYGFIGGASGKISKNEILFFGDITKHRDYYSIKEFTDARGIEIISLDFQLTDFGGIVPIKENNF